MGAMHTKHKKKRSLRSLLIEPFQQMKFGLYMLAVFVLFVCITGFLIFKTFLEQYRNVMEVFHVVDPQQQWELVTNNVFYTNALMLGGFFLISLVAILVIVIRLTHRYYGPIVAIERFVDALIRGNYEAKVVLRNKDELQELAAKLNELAVALRQRHPRSVEGDPRK